MASSLCAWFSLWCLKARGAPVAKLFIFQGEKHPETPFPMSPLASHPEQPRHAPDSRERPSRERLSPSTCICPEQQVIWLRPSELRSVRSQAQVGKRNGNTDPAFHWYPASLEPVGLPSPVAHAQQCSAHSEGRTWQLLKVRSLASAVWAEAMCRRAGNYPEGQWVSGRSRGGVHSFWSGRRAGIQRGSPGNKEITQSSGGEAAVTLCPLTPTARTSVLRRWWMNNTYGWPAGDSARAAYPTGALRYRGFGKTSCILTLLTTSFEKLGKIIQPLRVSISSVKSE